MVVLKVSCCGIIYSRLHAEENLKELRQARRGACLLDGWVVVFVASYFSSTDVSMSFLQLAITIARCEML